MVSTAFMAFLHQVFAFTLTACLVYEFIAYLLSIDPTIRYIRWSRALRQNNLPEISEPEYRRTRLLLWLEVIGIAVILLAAPMMARGIGMN
jgi:putative membrane protein